MKLTAVMKISKMVSHYILTHLNASISHAFVSIPGDLQNEQSVLEWLIDDDNRELADEIEAVNDRMLERLLEESPLLAVFFCEFVSLFSQKLNCYIVESEISIGTSSEF